MRLPLRNVAFGISRAIRIESLILFSRRLAQEILKTRSRPRVRQLTFPCPVILSRQEETGKIHQLCTLVLRQRLANLDDFLGGLIHDSQSYPRERSNQRSRSTIPSVASTTLIMPLTVKNETFTFDKSPGRTSACSTIKSKTASPAPTA
jgi:hypothetical protein